MSFEKGDLEVPKSFSVNLFERALKQGLRDSSIKVTTVVVKAGNKPGENYCSTGYSVAVTFTRNDSSFPEESVELFAKVIVSSPAAQFIKDGNVFQREYDMYTDALPTMQKLLGNETLAPKCFYYTNENEVDTIIFENATSLGYILADRVAGLDEEHCALVFRKLAKYHAASMVMAKQHPDIFEKFKTDVMAQNRKKSPAIYKTLNMTCNGLIKSIASWPGFEETSRKFEKFASELKAGKIELHTPAEASFQVLLHNDLWTNNILFKYQNNVLTDLFLIDHQLCYYSSPGVDITHFLYTSPQAHLLEFKREHMIEEYYYKTLESTLRNLGFESIPTLENIYEEIAKSEINGFHMCILKMYAICMDPEECSDNSFETFVHPEKGVEKREIGMSSERFIAINKYVLRRMEQMGILN